VVSHSPGDMAAVAVLRPTAFRLDATDGVGAVDLHDAEVADLPTGASGKNFSPWRRQRLTPGCMSFISIGHA
jgi:hypothetical protein